MSGTERMSARRPQSSAMRDTGARAFFAHPVSLGRDASHTSGTHYTSLSEISKSCTFSAKNTVFYLRTAAFQHRSSRNNALPLPAFFRMIEPMRIRLGRRLSRRGERFVASCNISLFYLLFGVHQDSHAPRSICRAPRFFIRTPRRSRKWVPSPATRLSAISPS